MNRPRRNRYRAGGVLLVAAALLAAVGALAGFAVARDGNDDRIPDRWEKRHNLSLKVKQTHRDQDRDHLRNRAEFLVGDDPRDRDSDDDGVMDGEEHAGRIASFDPATGKLTIDLFGGDSISGLVTPATRIKCEDEDRDDDSQVVARASHDEIEPGDDHGGDGGEPNDDSGSNSGPGSSNSGPGSSNSGPGRGDHDDDDANCTVAALTPGAVVKEAELEIEDGIAAFEEVELAD